MSSPVTYRYETGPLDADDFVAVAEPGFGDPQNGRAHAMAWFEGRLYVGVTRDPRAGHFRRRRKGAFKAGRGHVSDYRKQHGQIWRYTPETDAWECTRDSAGDIGYRSMLPVFSTKNAGSELYVTTISAAGAAILRTRDGERFTREWGPGACADGAVTWSLRPLVLAQGWLYTAPVGSVRGEDIERNRAPAALVYARPSEGTASWTTVNEPGFGDQTNVAIFEMAAFGDEVYAGTVNPFKGFQLWRRHARGRDSPWQRVLADGAFRGNANESVTTMAVFNGALYVGTGVEGLAPGEARESRVTLGAEVIRIWPDDTWELVVGEERPTFDGKRAPLSGLGPGFDDPWNTCVWRLAEHGGYLYAGTQSWSSVIGMLRERVPGVGRRLGGVSLESDGGFALWRSRDGANWEPVTLDGFAEPLNYGLRTMASTPAGLFLGTATLPPGVLGEENDEGGCEIFLGAPGD